MDAQRRHHVDLHVAVKQDVEPIQPPAQRRGNQRALLGRRDLSDRGECGGSHWRWILQEFNHKGHEGTQRHGGLPEMPKLPKIAEIENLANFRFRACNRSSFSATIAEFLVLRCLRSSVFQGFDFQFSLLAISALLAINEKYLCALRTSSPICAFNASIDGNLISGRRHCRKEISPSVCAVARRAGAPLGNSC